MKNCCVHIVCSFLVHACRWGPCYFFSSASLYIVGFFVLCLFLSVCVFCVVLVPQCVCVLCCACSSVCACSVLCLFLSVCVCSDPLFGDAPLQVVVVAGCVCVVWFFGVFCSVLVPQRVFSDPLWRCSCPDPTCIGHSFLFGSTVSCHHPVCVWCCNVLQSLWCAAKPRCDVLQSPVVICCKALL